MMEQRDGPDMNHSKAIVIFGATGDLAQKMLFPSLYFLDADGLLPEGLKIHGTARGEINFADKLREAIKERAAEGFSDEVWTRFAARLDYTAGDAQDEALYRALAEKLKGAGETVFYLAVSPDFFAAI
jgi:glucose-6-phosphate 1-dehydrogenase